MGELWQEPTPGVVLQTKCPKIQYTSTLSNSKVTYVLYKSLSNHILTSLHKSGVLIQWHLCTSKTLCRHLYLLGTLDSAPRDCWQHTSVQRKPTPVFSAYLFLQRCLCSEPYNIKNKVCLFQEPWIAHIMGGKNLYIIIRQCDHFCLSERQA